MIKPLSCMLLTLLLLLTLSSHNIYADFQPDTSFFSFYEHSLLAYTDTVSSKRILAADIQLTPPIIIATPTAYPVEPASQLSDVTTYILNGINEYRTSLGLSPVQASAETCSFAAIRAKEIATNGFSHDGFYSRVNTHTIPYTTWARATENIAEAPDYKEVVTLWKNSPEHAANMRDNTPYVCVMQYNNYYAYEGMRL